MQLLIECVWSVVCASLVYVQSPVQQHFTATQDSDLKPCDVKTLLDGGENPLKMVLEGVDVQRGYGLVSSEDGRQAQLATVAVDAWHIREFDDFEIPAESVGQLHEGDTYVIRWKYSITSVGEWDMMDTEVLFHIESTDTWRIA